MVVMVMVLVEQTINANVTIELMEVLHGLSQIVLEELAHSKFDLNPFL
jgi:hypothetical protein